MVLISLQNFCQNHFKTLTFFTTAIDWCKKDRRAVVVAATRVTLTVDIFIRTLSINQRPSHPQKATRPSTPCYRCSVFRANVDLLQIKETMNGFMNWFGWVWWCGRWNSSTFSSLDMIHSNCLHTWTIHQFTNTYRCRYNFPQCSVPCCSPFGYKLSGLNLNLLGEISGRFCAICAADLYEHEEAERVFKTKVLPPHLQLFWW